MPTTRVAGGRVRIMTSDEGQIISVSGKALTGRSMLTLERYQDSYQEQGVTRMGTDELGRLNRFGFSNSGYIVDVETVEGYVNALASMVRQIRDANARYADENNIAPEPVAVQARL